MSENGWARPVLADLEPEEDAPVQYVGPLSPAELCRERLKLARDLLELDHKEFVAALADVAPSLRPLLIAYGRATNALYTLEAMAQLHYREGR
jgi:hypothetical protein